jgi:hypothetical protein
MFRPVVLAALLFPALAAGADKPAVVELFEDDTDALIPLLTMGGISGGEQVKAEAETADVFAGKRALRVAPAQRFNPDIKGWSFPIVEKPKAGEYRYLRFAWKKVGDGPLMLQLCSRNPEDWGHRYHTGGSPPWAAVELSPAAPDGWILVTRDLFKDFGAFTLGGIAFTPLHGGDGLFDHILLGRTVADLDRATAATMIKMPTPEPLTESQLKQIWEHLGHADAAVGETAMWALVRGRKEAVPFLLKTVSIPNRKAPVAVDAAKVKPLIDDLKHYRYVVRESAVAEMFQLGDGVVPHLRAAAAAADGEFKARLIALLDRWGAVSNADERRLRHCAAVLRAVDAPEAKELLARIQKALP